jgi:predicted nucleic acid-binding protein
MSIVVVDTNILFSALRSKSSKIRLILGPISLANAIYAYRLCSDIDEKAPPFVALTLELEGKLWTRDEVLKQGLTNKNFTDFFDESRV